MKKSFQIFSLVLAISLLAGCHENEPAAPENSGDGGNTGGSQTTDTISPTPPVNPFETPDTDYNATCALQIVYNGTTATASEAPNGVEVAINGADVIVTNTIKGLQIIANGNGTGSLKIYSTYKYQMLLQDLTLQGNNGPAINNQGKKTLLLVLSGQNNLSDQSGYATENASGEDQKAAFFSEGQVVIYGSGSLNIDAKNKHALASDDYIVMTNGTVTLSTSADAAKGMKANDYISITGGNLTVKQSGSIVTEADDVTHCAAIKADSTIAISGGTIVIESSAEGGRGIHSEQDILILGGNISIAMTGTGSESGGWRSPARSITAGGPGGGGPGGGGPGGSSSSDIKGKGIRAEGQLLMSGGEVYVSTTGTAFEGVESKTYIELSGGKLYAISEKDDAINCAGAIVCSGAWVYAVSNGNDAIDSNYGKSGAITISGGVVVALSAAGSPEEGLDCDNNKYITISGGYVFSGGGAQGGGWGGSSTSESVGSASQPYCFTGSYAIQKGNYYTVYNSSNEALFTIKAATSVSSSKNSLSLISAPNLTKSGTNKICSGNSVPTGGTAWEGYIYTGGSSSATTSVKTFTGK